MVAALLNYYTEGAAGGVTLARKRLLICAPSNTAVDELLSRMSGGIADGTGGTRMLHIVRLGEPLEGASEAIKRISLDTLVEERLRQDEAWLKLERAKDAIAKLDRELQSLPAIRESTGVSSERDTRPQLSKEALRVRSLRTDLASQRQVKVWAEMAVERARAALRQQILLEADVVGATLSGSGKKQFLDMALQNDVTFETAIVDEAAQATEPSCLIPLRLGCRRLVLVGDPRQLPATVLSKSAAQAGLGRSLFERLERADHEVVMLTIQYRMHPGNVVLSQLRHFHTVLICSVAFLLWWVSIEIRQFPSRYFYQNLLTDAPAAQAVQLITIPRGQAAPAKLAPSHFLDLRIANDTPSGKSYVNDAEISLVTRLLAALLPHARDYSVAVIAPYKAQVTRIKRALREDTVLASLQNERRRNDADIDVNSVDGFQGREKDIVIFSAVRSNLRHQNDTLRPLEPGEVTSAPSSRGGFSIGFVSDERRLNVAITRAKRLLIVVGNAGTLATDVTWQAMLQDLGERRRVSRVRRLDDVRSDSSIIDLLSDKKAI
jgi:senataxin